MKMSTENGILRKQVTVNDIIIFFNNLFLTLYFITQSHPDRPLAAIYDLPRSAISGQRAPVYTDLMWHV